MAAQRRVQATRAKAKPQHRELRLFEGDDAADAVRSAEEEKVRGETDYTDGRPCLGALVTLQSEEGYLRCLEDYRRLSSGKWPCTRWLTPQALRFTAAAHRGEHPSIIHIEPAPDPSNILYHNMHVSKTSRRVRWCVSTLLLLVRLAYHLGGCVCCAREAAFATC